MIRAPKSLFYKCYLSNAEFEQAERNVFETALSQDTTGINWWNLVENCLEGIENYVFHVFFYDANQVVAMVSGQYFPALSLRPYVNTEQLNAHYQKEIENQRYACLMIHSFSSVCSIWAICWESVQTRLNQFISEFAEQNLLHVTLVRNLSEQQRVLFDKPTCNKLQLWHTIGGFPRYLSSFKGCGEIEDYFSKRIADRKRRNKLRASLRKLAFHSEYTICSVTNEKTLQSYIPQILELKNATYQRNASQLSIPLFETASYFQQCFTWVEGKSYFYVIKDSLQNLVGYICAVANGKQARALSIGVKLPEGKQIDAWYNLLLYLYSDLIRDGIDSINLGLGNGEIKSRLGAVPTPLFTAVRFNTFEFDWNINQILPSNFKEI